MIGMTFAMLFSIVVLGLFGFSESVDAFTVTHNQITSGITNDLSPTLGNNGTHDIVVYTQLDASGLGLIGYHVLNSNGSPNGSPVIISDGTTNDRLNDISGNNIVYTAFLAGGALGQVTLYDISTGVTTAVSIIGPIQEARIHGDAIAWVDGSFGASQIKLTFVPLIGTGASPITLGVPGSTGVEVGERFVTWSEPGAGGTLDIAAYEILSGFTLPVAANPTTHETEPSTSGDWITWQFTSAIGGSAIAALNLDTFDARIIVEDGSNSRLPTIDGDFLAYESDVTGNFDVYVHRLSDAQIFQITTSTSDQVLNNVFGNLLSYSDLAGPVNGDIYVSNFDFNIPVPTIDSFIPPSGTIGPANVQVFGTGEPTFVVELFRNDEIGTEFPDHAELISSNGDWNVLLFGFDEPLAPGIHTFAARNVDPITNEHSPLSEIVTYVMLSGIDDDGDGVDNVIDVCPGFDDTVDSDGNGIPDGCDIPIDFDNDGFSQLTDCDDNDDSVFPGATETPYDGIDQDCDGFDLVDVDVDGFDSTVAGGLDCDDNNTSINPGVTEEDNGVDDNCDGVIDEGFDADVDGFTPSGGDCDDGNASINPLAIEVFDGIDNNCDGFIDEGFTDTDGDGVHDGVDNCMFIVNSGQEDADMDGIGDACDTVAPEQEIQILIDTIDSMNLGSSVENALTSNLDSAIDKLIDGNPSNDSAACGKINSFVNKVDAFEGKSLTTVQADLLRVDAQNILSSIGCV